MPLINTIADAQANGVRLAAVADNYRMPDLTTADTLYIIPVLGRPLYDSIIATGLTDALLIELRSFAKKVAAPLGFYFELPNLHATISSTGVQTVANADMPKTFRWEFEQLRDSLEQKGLIAMEALWQFLHNNATDLDWQSPHGSPLFVNGSDFNKYFPLYQPYRSFEQLRPLVQQAVEQYVYPTIGEQFFEAFIIANHTTPLDKQLMKLLKMAVANLTIRQSVELLPVRISNQGFTVSLKENKDMPDQGRANAPENQLSLLHQRSQRNGESFLNNCVELLNKNAAATIYPIYFNSPYYSSPSTVVQNINANSKTFFL